MANYRFGKHPAKHDYRTLRFKNYLKPGIASATCFVEHLNSRLRRLEDK